MTFILLYDIIVLDGGKVQNVTVCSIMKKRGITKHDSPEGKELCLHCPFEVCELDVEESDYKRAISDRKRIVISLHEEGINMVEISSRIGLSYGTVRMYIKEAKKH